MGERTALGFIQFISALLHDPRTFIAQWIVTLGAVWVYAPLFLIIFMETGLVFTPFLPGDSLLFCAGVFAADGGGLNVWALLVLMSAAAILGNTSNYWIGHAFGAALVKSKKVKALTPERMEKTQRFFDKYGLFAIVLTRFFPIIRTIAPFVAGIGRMHFGRFTVFNCVGGISWVSVFTMLGYFFGGVPFVEEHFELVIVLILVISLVPAAGGAIGGLIKSRQSKRAARKAGAVEAAGPAESEGVTEVAAAPTLGAHGEKLGKHSAPRAE